MRGRSASSPPGLVGRSRELDVLRGTLDEVRSGRGRFVLLVGQPGIGKTRLAEELASLARDEGFLSLRGACHQREGTPPFWPWVQILRSCVASEGGPAILEEAGVRLAPLVRLLPETARRGAEPPSPETEGSARFRLFDAVGAFLQRASRHRPVLAVVDDLHWADESSLILLEFLVRELASASVMILGTSREAEPPGHRPVADLLSRVPGRTLPLGGLDRGAVRRLMADTVGVPPSERTVRIVHRQTEGNPFFVTEIAAWLEEEPDAGAGLDLGSLRLPDSVRGVIGRRLRRLSGTARHILRDASVAGREFEPHLLADASGGLRPEDVGNALAEAVAAGVVADLGGRFRFRHALIRQALYEEVRPPRRARLHARLGRALEVRYGPAATEHAAELAHHFTGAASLLGPQKAIEYSRAAAKRALEAHAYEDAVERLEGALAMRSGAPLDTGAAGLLSALGRARAASSPRWNRQEAWRDLRRAAEHHLDRGDLPEAVEAVTYGGITPEGAREIADLVRRVLAAVPEGSTEAGRLWARYGAAVYFEGGDRRAALSAFERALSIARRSKDAGLELRTLAYRTAVDHFAIRWSDVIAGSRRVLELAREVDDAHAETYARYRMSFALAFAGRSDEAAREARVNLARAEGLKDHGLLEDALWINTALAQARGDWDRARALVSRGLEISPRHLPLLHLAVLLEYELGRTGDGERLHGRLREASAHAGPYPLKGAFRALVTPQIAELTDTEPPPPPPLPGPSSVPVARMLVAVGRALTAVRTGDPGLAAEELDRLAPFRGVVVAPILVTDRLLGRLAHLLGRSEEAHAHFEGALHFCRSAGYTPELAWSCHDYARSLLEGEGQSTRRSPVDLLDEAAAWASRLGMGPLAERVARLRDEGRGEPHGLTSRELDVLRLVATGRTNREIARRLSISPHTVAVHVGHILEKTGRRNRTEAASLAIREGLAERPGAS